MAKSTRRGSKKPRTPRQPRQPKDKETGSLTPQQHLRHSVFALIHQPGQAAKFTVAEAEIALRFVLDQEYAPIEACGLPEQAQIIAQGKAPFVYSDAVVQELSPIRKDDHAPRKHFDPERIDM